MKFYILLRKFYYNLLKLKSRVVVGRPVLVLMYHRINDEIGQKIGALSVSVSTFEKQLIYYQKHFQILTLNEDWSSLRKTGLVITFDDGYADNIINALPLLEKYQIPATIFVSTLNIDTKNEFWWDRLVFDYTSCKEFFYSWNEGDEIIKSNTSYKKLNDQIDKLSNEDKEKWFLEFEKINEIQFSPREQYRSLTKSELQFLSQHPLITLGAHTHNHYPLGNLSYEEQKQELLFSIKKLNELTAKSIGYLALPHGSYNSDTLKIVKDLDLKVLLANDYYSSKLNKKSEKINRILMPNIEGKELIKRLGKFDFKYLNF